MKPLKVSRRPLIAMLAALATTAIAMPAATHAELSGLVGVKMSASCDHIRPVVFTKVKCSGTVRNFSPTGGAPTGQLRLVNESTFAGAFPTGNHCALQPVAGSPNVSSCSVVYEPQQLDLQLLDMAYLGDATFDPAMVQDIPLNTIFGEPTTTELICQKVNFGEAGRCIVMVRVQDIEALQRTPGGTVAFSPIPINAPVEFSSPSCQLQPLTTSLSFCAVDYRPIKPGTWVFRAAYEGSSVTKHHRSRAETTVTVKHPVNAPL